MMEVIFLGVGEAFDENLPNTSILIRYKAGQSTVTLLLDCGFTAPPPFWKEVPEVDALDGIWLSHFHGDHCLGLPALLVRFWEEGRSKALTILGQTGIDSFTRKALDLAYPGFIGKLTFPIRFMEVEPKREVELFGLLFRSAENGHSLRDLALRIDATEKSIYYSGDGSPTSQSMALAKGSELVIQEAFHMETEFPGHCTVRRAMEMAKSCEALNLAMVHIQREMRRQVIDRMPRLVNRQSPLQVVVPEPGHRMAF